MTRVAVLSDTHIPSRAERIPEWVKDEIRSADHVVHAGDFDSPAALESIEDLVAGEFTAVHGNLDPKSLDLPRVRSVEIDGQSFVVTHGSGPVNGYQDRVAETVREATDADGAVGIAGHTHEVIDTVHGGVRLLNPGSATGADPATEATMMRVEVGGGLGVEVLRE